MEFWRRPHSSYMLLLCWFKTGHGCLGGEQDGEEVAVAQPVPRGLRASLGLNTMERAMPGCKHIGTRSARLVLTLTHIQEYTEVTGHKHWAKSFATSGKKGGFRAGVSPMHPLCCQAAVSRAIKHHSQNFNFFKKGEETLKLEWTSPFIHLVGYQHQKHKIN